MDSLFYFLVYISSSFLLSSWKVQFCFRYVKFLISVVMLTGLLYTRSCLNSCHKKEWPKLFLLQFYTFYDRNSTSVYLQEVSYLMSFTFLVWCSCNPDFSLCFLPLQSLNWWINFLLLPSTFMTLVNFVSFCVSVLWCALFLLLPNVSLK